MIRRVKPSYYSSIGLPLLGDVSILCILHNRNGLELTQEALSIIVWEGAPRAIRNGLGLLLGPCGLSSLWGGLGFPWFIVDTYTCNVFTALFSSAPYQCENMSWVVTLLNGACCCVDLDPLIILNLVCKHNTTQHIHQDDNNPSVTTTLVPVKEELTMSLLLKVLLFPSSLIVSFVFVAGWTSSGDDFY
jgi:hypothetical protein